MSRKLASPYTHTQRMQLPWTFILIPVGILFFISVIVLLYL